MLNFFLFNVAFKKIMNDYIIFLNKTMFRLKVSTTYIRDKNINYSSKDKHENF